MKLKNLIEIFPSIPIFHDDCCNSDSEKDSFSGCCEGSQNFFEDSLKIKEQLKDYFNESINVHIYNYDLSIDRVMAKKKLRGLFKKKGFQYISEDEIIKYVTPTVVVNGNLISFSTKPNIESIITELLTSKAK